MTWRPQRCFALALLIGAMLGGGYLIVERNHAVMGGSEEMSPSGMLH